MNFEIDPRFKDHLRNLKQVFLYVTDECNLRCAQCLYKPDLTFHLKEKEIELPKALALVSDFREMGALKLTIMGGEPTLYGNRLNHEPLTTLIAHAKTVGYEYVRMDTNGTFEPALLAKLGELDEISFSLDGPTAEINDKLRGTGTFKKCVSNIRKAVALGYHVDITCCLHHGLLQRGTDGRVLLDSLVDFAASLGVRRVNFHDLFKTGAPRDTWTGDWDIPLQRWLDAYAQIQSNISAGLYRIPVRIPQSFVAKREFERNPSYYGYCPAKLGERALVHPNGVIRICSLLIGTPYGIGRFYDNKIVWDESSTNELRDHQINIPTPCTNQDKNRSFGDFVPLCVSFKPKQDELIWVQKLSWEGKGHN